MKSRTTGLTPSGRGTVASGATGLSCATSGPPPTFAVTRSLRPPGCGHRFAKASIGSTLREKRFGAAGAE